VSEAASKIPLAELGALVECLAALERSKPGSGAAASIDNAIDANLRSLQPDEVGKHFEWVPGHEGRRRLWCRIPPTGDGPMRFVMGSPRTEQGRRDHEDQVEVQLVAPFVMAAAPVTWRQYALMLRDRTVAQGYADKPVVEVSWFEACLFARWLQRQRRRLPAEFGRVLVSGAQAMEFALPSEAQWEYACRAGTTTRFWSDGGDGDSEAALDRVGWFRDNSEHRLHRVAEKEPNGWKLFDMHGNVWEWCADWYGDKLGDVVGGPPGGRARVLRGGSFRYDADWCRSAFRNWDVPDSAWTTTASGSACLPPSTDLEGRGLSVWGHPGHGRAPRSWRGQPRPCVHGQVTCCASRSSCCGAIPLASGSHARPGMAATTTTGLTPACGLRPTNSECCTGHDRTRPYGHPRPRGYHAQQPAVTAPAFSMRPEEVAPARRLRRMDITIREAAPLLGRSPRAIRARIARGELPARRQGHTWVLPLEHLPLTAAQRASMLGRADDARAAVEQALPSRLASTRARKHRSVLDLDSFRTAREVLLEIAKTPEPDLGHPSGTRTGRRLPAGCDTTVGRRSRNNWLVTAPMGRRGAI
jgi:hypothetical protein